MAVRALERSSARSGFFYLSNAAIEQRAHSDTSFGEKPETSTLPVGLEHGASNGERDSKLLGSSSFIRGCPQPASKRYTTVNARRYRIFSQRKAAGQTQGRIARRSIIMARQRAAR